MSENKVIRLLQSSTSTAKDSAPSSSASTQHSDGSTPPALPPIHLNLPEPPDNIPPKHLYMVLGFIFLWLGGLTGLFYNESSKIKSDINVSQKEIMGKLNEYQMDLSKQLSEFEQRRTDDIKFFLEQQNSKHTAK